MCKKYIRSINIFKIKNFHIIVKAPDSEVSKFSGETLTSSKVNLYLVLLSLVCISPLTNRLNYSIGLPQGSLPLKMACCGAYTVINGVSV